MSESIVKVIHEQLNEEKWTRAAINSYSISNFQDLDELVARTVEAHSQDEVLALCEEHLKHTKNSIIALYLSGIIALKKQLIDDSNLIILINLFADNHKWNIVEFLCNRILEFGENKFALRALSECYESKNEPEQKFNIWERLIKVDYDETEIVKLLAEKKEQEGDLVNAVEYYKKAIHRFINKKMFSNAKDIWEKLIALAPDDIDFFFTVERKIVKVLNDERAASLLNLLYPYYHGKKNWEVSIEILKRILTHDPKNAAARKEIVECFRELHKQHSHIEEYIRISNLTQSWRNVHDAIADFEKHIAFDLGNFIYHRSWGIGKIVNIKDDIFYITFPGKPEHKMSLKMAVSALEILKPDHIWVIKTTQPKDELKKQVKKDPAWALRVIIKSFGNNADMKRIKAELVPDVLTPAEWSKWGSDARKILKTDPAFGNLPDKIDSFVVREKPISFEEKTFNKFKAEKSFFDRIQTIQDFCRNAEPDSDFFSDMFSYFTGFLKSTSTVNEYTISSFLLIQRIVAQYPYLNPGIELSFPDLFARIENLEELFKNIDDLELKKAFLLNVKRSLANWPELFIRMFPHYLNRLIIDELVANGSWPILRDLIHLSVNHYKEYRESFIWIARNLAQEPWFSRMEILFEKIFIGMIHLLDIGYREIASKRNVSLNRKLCKQVEDFLFKEEKLIGFLLTAGEDSITRLYTLVDDIKDLKPSIKIQLKHRIKEAYPDYHFLGEEEKHKVSLGLMVTRVGYETKQKELRHIIEVDIPENSKEIGSALSKGDLRENAEYKAALERQEMLKATASRLQEDLQKAQLFDAETADDSIISFGTKVRLRNNLNGAAEEFIILGPWESDPNRNIISYLSPFGMALNNHRQGESLRFTINEQDFDYLIESIEKAEVEKTLG